MSLKGRLGGIAVRAVLLLLVISASWPHLAPFYTRFLVTAAQPLAPQGITLSQAKWTILVNYSKGAVSQGIFVDGFTLQSGLILVTVLIGATPGLGARGYVLWLLLAGSFLVVLHVVGVWLLSTGFAWAAAGNAPRIRVGDILRAFAVYWGLLPAVVGAAWCLKFWLPRLRDPVHR